MNDMNSYTIRRLSRPFITSGVVMLLFGSYLSAYILVKQNAARNTQAWRTVLETRPRDKIQRNRDSGSQLRTIDKRSQTNRTVIWTRLPTGTQMGERQVAAVKSVMKYGSNLLVWGLGNDSPFWHDITNGKVIFIEPAGVWYDKITRKYPYLEVYTVNYTTNNNKSFPKYINKSANWSDLDLRSQLPAVVVQTPWDAIIVDTPPGYSSATPGRYQSIYTSSLLARNGTHVFVDDYERKVEREFSQKVLGIPVKVIKRSSKRHSAANEQAHFIRDKK